MNIPIYNGDIPFVTTEQMIEVDRAMIEDYRIELIQMMENAGRNLAHLARERFFAGEPSGRQVVVLAGTGGNGGGALVCARRLHNYGAQVQIFIVKPDEAFTTVPAHQLSICRQLGIPIRLANDISPIATPDLIIDGVIGYSLNGNPRGGANTLISWANEQHAPILALDAPSGIDTATGQLFAPAIKATATMTLALPKAGLLHTTVEKQVGELYLADISVPPELYGKPPLNLTVGSIFATSDIVRLR